jgi:hypothetical protein
MRTSGASRSDALIFILPAVIFLGFFVWASGGPADTLAAFDQFLRRAAVTVVSWLSSFDQFLRRAAVAVVSWLSSL